VSDISQVERVQLTWKVFNWFLLHDTMLARYMLLSCVSVCPSVRLSVTSWQFYKDD